MTKVTGLYVLLLLVAATCLVAAQQLPVEAHLVWSRDFFHVVPADLDGDEEDELVTMPTCTRLNVQDQRLYHLTGEYAFPTGTFEDRYLIGGSAMAGLWVTYVRNDSLFLRPAAKQRAYFVAAGRDTARDWNGHAVQVNVLDLDADGRLEAVIAVGSGSGLAPRGIVVLDWESGNSLWHHWCGPNPYRLLYDDIDSDGRTEILMSTSAPGNGNSDNGTDDLHTHVSLLDCTGQEVWRTSLGRYSSILVPAWLTPTEGEGTVLFVGETGNPAGGRDRDSVFVLDPGTGRILRSACHGEFNSDYAVLHDSSGQSLVAFWSSDELLLIDASLVLVRRSRLPGTHAVRVAAGQFSGTGRDELAVLTGTGRLHVYGLDLRRFVDIPVGHSTRMMPVRAAGRTRLMLYSPFDDHIGCTLFSFRPVPLLDRGVPLGWSLAAGALLLAVFGVVLVAVRLRQTRDVRLLVRSLTGQAGAIELDRRGSVTRTNRKARDILPRGHTASGNKALPSEGPLAPLAGLVKAVLAEPTDASSREMPVSVDPDQTLLARATRVKSGVLLTLEDISAVEYMRRVKAWGPVAQRLAHGIKTPLSTIRLTAQQLEDEGDSETGRVIQEEVDRLSKMTDGFMRLADFEPLNLESKDLNRIVERVLDEQGVEMQPELEAKLELAYDLPQVLVDEEQLVRALANLVDNAVSAMHGKGWLLVATRVADSGREIEVEVTDNGPGIPEAYLPKLFLPFFTRKPGGTGLGLSIVKKVVEDHGGRVEVDSRVGEGTTFRVHLPVARGLA